jgi:hypothetical protein
MLGAEVVDRGDDDEEPPPEDLGDPFADGAAVGVQVVVDRACAPLVAAGRPAARIGGGGGGRTLRQCEDSALGVDGNAPAPA